MVVVEAPAGLVVVSVKWPTSLANSGRSAGALKNGRVQSAPPIAIATDCNPGSSPATSLLLMLNMACTLFRLTPEEALRTLATATQVNPGNVEAYILSAQILASTNRVESAMDALLTAADIDAGITYNCDIQGLVTRVTWSQGGTSGAVKAADYDTIGEISGSVSSISTVTGDGADHASMLANTSPRGPYIGSLAIDMMTATAPVAALVATTGILSKITLTGMPSQTPPGSTVLEVTGESETISHTTWRVTYTTKPAGLGSARDLLITDDAIYGVTDSTHRVAY